MSTHIQYTLFINICQPWHFLEFPHFPLKGGSHHEGHSAAFGRNQILPLKTLNSLNTTFYGTESCEYHAENFLKKQSFAHL